MADFFNAAIVAHVDWRLRLNAAVASGKVPDRETACSDHHCDLGRWIYGEGQQYAELAEFQQLKGAHRRFHAAVGRIIDLVAAEDIAAAKVELASGDFAAYSVETVTSIGRLHAAI